MSNLSPLASPQESPVFNFISNLSPIQPVKAAPVAQGFPGLASPPLVFRSPRNSLLSVFNRQLRSSAFTTEFSQDNDKGQKTHENPGGSANPDLGLQSQVSKNQKGCNTKKLGQFVRCSPSGCFDEFLRDPIECYDPLYKKRSGDVPQSSEVGCLEKKDNGTDEDIVPDGSTLLKVTERAKAMSKISIKVVKNEPKRLTSASSECPGILTKLPIGHTSELCQTGDSFSEASYFERSLRRCLFDENESENSADGSGFWNPNENLSRIQEVANMSSSGTPGNSQMINLPKPKSGMSVSPITGNHPVFISKPLGIGLHLNSVVYPGTKDRIIGQQASEKVVRVEGKNSVFVVSNQPAGNVCESSVPTSQIDKFPATSEEIYKSKPCSVATSSRTFASDAVELFNNPIVLKPDHPSATVYNKRKLNSELAESNEEFNQGSPKKKRRKSSGTGDDDTDKLCNCKKSKCLKLYCDCFAAGFYCGESCSCQGCFNRPEFEGTVLETRQQIESRNPLAFAPKVVQPVTDSPARSKEVENLSTPSSARHKRGCNCKKSMCLKKYCECYQSNVGCSDNCRCEGCKNVYGIREDFSNAREFMIKVTEATPTVILDEKKEISTVRGNIVNSRVHNSPNVTPVTPVLQCSDKRKNALNSRLAFSRCLQSPDSSHDILLSDEDITSPPISSPSHRVLDDEPLDPEKGCENSDRLLSPCERPANACDSVSTFASSSSKTRDLFHVSRPETFARSSLPHSSSHLRWRSSPVTPFTQSAGSEYLPNHDSGSKESDVLGDDTPEILKDSATPTESVKVRSPNKKRISPPHSRVDSPESLRHSRKFVLQAVCNGLDHRNLPKFPPVSSFSQNSGNDKRNESLDP